MFLSYLKKIDPNIRKQFIRYLIVGFSSFVLEYGFFFLLYQTKVLSVLWANFAAMTIVFWFNFILNKFWSFRSKTNIYHQILQYGVLFVFNLTVSNIGLKFLSNNIGISPLLSKISIMGLIVMWNFIIYRTVIYKN